MASWLDDLQARVEQATSGIVTDINAYINTRVVEPVVKIGQPQSGNLTAAQIAAGQKGTPAPIAAPKAQAKAVQNAVQASQLAENDWIQYAPILIAGIGAFFFFKKSRG